MTECAMKDASPCYGEVHRVLGRDGLPVYVCTGHYEDVFVVAWK